jgi:hypothetical protein
VKDLRHRYLVQRSAAKHRGIEFLLTYSEWLEIWTASGHFHERGRFRGQYVMARFGDQGSYEVDNVKIVTTEYNLSESNRGKRLTPEHCEKIRVSNLGNKRWLGKRHTADTKKRMADASRGTRHTEESKRKMSEARKRWHQQQHTPSKN